MQCYESVHISYTMQVQGEMTLSIYEIAEYLAECPAHNAGDCRQECPERLYRNFPIRAADETCGEYFAEVQDWILANREIILDSGWIADAVGSEEHEITITEVARVLEQQATPPPKYGRSIQQWT